MESAHLKRRLTAVMLADVVGYCRLMSVDEEDTHVRLAAFVQNLIAPKIAEHEGRLIRTMGDGFLAKFDSAADAVHCGLEIQEELARRDHEIDPDQRIQLRIGINTGDVIVDERDIYGNSVNIAARLEGLAEPGEIYVTRGVRDHLQGYPSICFEDTGDRKVKNIKQPVRIYRVRHAQQQQNRALSRDVIGIARRLCRGAFFAHRRSTISVSVLLVATAGITVGALPVRRDYSLISSRVSIMVLPFRNANGNPEEDYFADAVTDDLTTDLSRLSDTAVISPATAFTYKGKSVDPREIGREFGVRYILDGSIRKTGMKVQTNARLVDTRTAAHLWADRFDNELTDLSELQDAITGRIASSLQVQLVKAESRRATAERPADPDATDLRLHAMAILLASVTEDHTLYARQFLDKSVEVDPNSAEGWSQLAWMLVNDYLSHWNEAKKGPDESKKLLDRAEDAVQKALQIDPTVALAHYADGLIRRARGNHPGALDAFDRAVQLDPNLARAWAQKANQLVMVGRPKEAPPLVLKAIRLSPRDPSLGVFYWIIGRAYFVMKNYDDAIVWLRKSVELMPNLWFSKAYLLSAYAHTKRHEQPEARTALGEYKSVFGAYTVQRIRDLYEKELPHTDPDVQASIQELYQGLKTAGVQER